MKRLQPYLPIVGLLLILAGLAVQYRPLVSGEGVDQVVTVYESATPKLNGVLLGPTSRALRVADRWRQYDQDVLPEDKRDDLEAAVEEYGVPCIVLYRSGRVVYSGPLPETDEALANLIQKQGGIL